MNGLVNNDEIDELGLMLSDYINLIYSEVELLDIQAGENQNLEINKNLTIDTL